MGGGSDPNCNCFFAIFRRQLYKEQKENNSSKLSVHLA